MENLLGSVLILSLCLSLDITGILIDFLFVISFVLVTYNISIILKLTPNNPLIIWCRFDGDGYVFVSLFLLFLLYFICPNSTSVFTNS